MKGRGAQAEDQALEFLGAQGLKLKERNFRCRLGEIDLIMGDGSTLVFVEVRARASNAFGGACDSITARKRDKLLAAARFYMTRSGRFPACRFDAVLIGPGGKIEWLRDAFGE